MIKYLSVVSFILITIGNIYAQQENNNLKIQYVECRGNNLSIALPADFKGPKYFNYEDGTIIDFYTPDTCVVSMLCGESGELKLDSTYQLVNTQPIGASGKKITYYSKALNRYARKDYLEEYLIMYDRANVARKNELDKVFDKLETK
ncbi:MAG: hypothetical protein P4L28_00940 [Paludibacteraceae bacterium]|nr:hypothetical protein [Paludibacteraceae bacterium]